MNTAGRLITVSNRLPVTVSVSPAASTGPACVLNAPCTVDLSACSESQKAAAWQGQTSLQGVLQLGNYTSHKNWFCMTPIGQAWPVVQEPGWWCGRVVQQCTCSPADGCY